MSSYQRYRGGALAYARHLRHSIADGLQVNNARVALRLAQRDMVQARRRRGTP